MVLTKARPNDLVPPVPAVSVCTPVWEPGEPVIHLVVQFDLGQSSAWDNAHFDDVDVWDIKEKSYVDLIGDCRDLSLHQGRPSLFNRVETGTLSFHLESKDGKYTQWDIWAAPNRVPMGAECSFWVEMNNVVYWLFHGFISQWEEDYTEVMPFVAVEATDYFALLNQGFAGDWDPGPFGQNVADRLNNILTLVASQPFTTNFENGDVTLNGPQSNSSPLEEMILTSDSDGGALFVDCDGTLMYLDRLNAGGRRDQVKVHVWGDSCEALQLTRSDPTTDDNTIANYITLRNLYDIQVLAQDPGSQATYRTRSYFMRQSTNLLWQTEAQGQALADHYLALWANSYLRYEQVETQSDADPNILPIAFDVRLYDQMQILRELPSTRQSLATVTVEGRIIEVSADTRAWTFTYVLSPALILNPLDRWDEAKYDTSKWGY